MNKFILTNNDLTVVRDLILQGKHYDLQTTEATYEDRVKKLKREWRYISVEIGRCGK